MSKLPLILFLTMLLFLDAKPKALRECTQKFGLYHCGFYSNSWLSGHHCHRGCEQYFTLKLGQDPDAVLLNEPSGQFAHQFTQTGDYPVRIRAHSTFDIYVEAWDTIHIELVNQTPLVPPQAIVHP